MQDIVLIIALGISLGFNFLMLIERRISKSMAPRWKALAELQAEMLNTRSVKCK